MTVQNVAVLGNNNLITLSIIQNAAVIDDKPVLKSATHAASDQSSTVSFAPEDFN